MKVRALGAVLIWLAVVAYSTGLAWAVGRKGRDMIWFGVKVGTGTLAGLALFVLGAYLIHGN